MARPARKDLKPEREPGSTDSTLEASLSDLLKLKGEITTPGLADLASLKAGLVSHGELAGDLSPGLADLASLKAGLVSHETARVSSLADAISARKRAQFAIQQSVESSRVTDELFKAYREAAHKEIEGSGGVAIGTTNEGVGTVKTQMMALEAIESAVRDVGIQVRTLGEIANSQAAEVRLFHDDITASQKSAGRLTGVNIGVGIVLLALTFVIAYLTFILATRPTP